MERETLIALVEALIEDSLQTHLQVIEGPVGPRGLRGRDGSDFDFETNRELIQSIISKLIPEKSELIGANGRDGKDGRDFSLEENREKIQEILSALIPEKSELIGAKGEDGRDGKDGREGKDFSLEENKEGIREIISSLIPDITELTGAKGEDGKDGRDGVDGQNGRDFSFEESREEIQEIISKAIPTADSLKGDKGDRGDRGRDGRGFTFDDEREGILELVSIAISEIRDTLKLHFIDLTTEEINSIRGPRGQRGKSGKDFVFEEHKEFFESLRPQLNIEELKLKFSDLTEEDLDQLRFKYEDFSLDQIETLRGPRGQRGKPGKDFDFEEHKDYFESLRPQINTEDLKLKFSDLSSDEVLSIKLKFSDLSEEEIESLKVQGPRGQRGKKGDIGDKGERGESGIQGEIGRIGPRGEKGDIGLKGPMGPIGARGVNGSDAPVVEDISLSSDRDGINLTFYFSDGTQIQTNSVKLNNSKSNLIMFPSTTSMGGSGGIGGGTANPTEYFEEGVSVGTSEKLNFVGNNITVTKSGDTVNVVVDDFVSTPTDYYDEGILKGSFSGLNFIGSGVTLTPNGSVADVTITDTDTITEYFDDGNSQGILSKVNFIGAGVTASPNIDGETIDVTIPGTDTNTTDLKTYKDGTLILTTDSIDFVGSEFVVSNVAGKATVSLNLPASSGSVGISDEYNEVSNAVTNINFIGDYVTVRPRVPMSDWASMSDVDPSLSDYDGGGNPSMVDVYIDIPDPTIQKNITCDVGVYVGALVRITSSKIAVCALADTYSNAQVMGIAISITGSKCDVKIIGTTPEIFSGLDPDADYFLSDTDPGKLTTTVPTISEHVELCVGQSFGTDQFTFIKGQRVVKA